MPPRRPEDVGGSRPPGWARGREPDTDPMGGGRHYATRAERRRAEGKQVYGDNPPIGLGGATTWVSLVVTALGALIPGAAFLAAGRRWLGGVLLALTAVALGILVWLGTSGQRTALHLAVDPEFLFLAGVGLPVLAVVWALVVVGGYSAVRPLRTSRRGRAVSATVVALLCVGVVVPTIVASRYALVQRDLITTVFAERPRSATVPTTEVDAADPWADTPRLNVLLLGGDGGVGRDGVRTDTVILASVDTATGDTVLFSLPRNLENLPFPAGPLREAYPDGFSSPAGEADGLLNAVYRNLPADHPDILGPTDDLGADALKLGVGEAIGLNVDYYMLVNLEGFRQLANALGGVTVNINTWVPIGGVTDLGQLPDDYLRPGPDQHLDGGQALWFARGRYGSSDYERMARQRCVIDSFIQEADPVTLLTRYQELAATTKDILTTDIPQYLLPAFLDLGLRIQDGRTTSIVFDNTVITPAYADYDFIRQTVALAIEPPAPPAPSTGSPTGSAPPPSSSSPPPPPDDDGTPTSPPVAESLDLSCAYDPVAAAEALAQGEPPTR